MYYWVLDLLPANRNTVKAPAYVREDLGTMDTSCSSTASMIVILYLRLSLPLPFLVPERCEVAEYFIGEYRQVSGAGASLRFYSSLIT